MKRCALTIAAGPKYWPSFQNTGHEDVHAAHRMHLVVSSKRSRSSADCRRSRVGSLPLVTRNGMTSRYAWKNGSMSTTRSLRTVRPLMASTVIGFSGLMSLISVLQASRFLPLIRIASEPQMPCAQERRKVSVPSMLPLDLVEGVEDTLLRVDLDLEVLPAGLRRDLGVEAADPEGDRDVRGVGEARPRAWRRPCPGSGLPSVLTLHRLVAGLDDRLVVEPDRLGAVVADLAVRHGVAHEVDVVAVRDSPRGSDRRGTPCGPARRPP